MYRFYPYINHQEDVVAVVESEYKIKTGAALPTLLVNKMIEYRRKSIMEAMKEGKTISFDGLGKLKITDGAKAKKAIKEELGADITASAFKVELKRRYSKGKLLSQQYGKGYGLNIADSNTK